MIATKLSCGEAIVRSLEAHGVELVFGIPGTHSLEIYRALADSRIRHVTPRHEQGAGFAADGYARVSGKPGVCLVTTGPAVTNVATAAAQAFSCSIPLLIVSPALPGRLDGKDTGWTHEAKDQQAAMNALVSWSHRATSPADAVAAVERAFEEFATRRPRPVHLGVPLDVLESKDEVEIRHGAVSAPAPLDPASIDRAADLLRGAARPALFVGGGARHAGRQVTDLAERLGAPVLTTVDGKGVLSEAHPLSLGAGSYLRAAADFLRAGDVVLAVGTELSEANFWQERIDLPGALIRVDIAPEQLQKNYPANVAILGDSARVLEALVRSLDERQVLSRRAAGVAWASEQRAAIRAEAETQGKTWLPLLRALRGALADDAILTGDSAMVCYYGAQTLFPVSGPNQFLVPDGYGTLGYGLPAAIGAKLAQPEREVVALMGDGGILFTIGELATAAELGLSIPIIVSNNHGYGEIKRAMRERKFRPFAVDLPAPDFPALGRAFGGFGIRLESLDELTNVLHTAFTAGGPTVIEIPEGSPEQSTVWKG
jgi:acetolactate synthase-1/2/3 large subunit